MSQEYPQTLELIAPELSCETVKLLRTHTNGRVHTYLRNCSSSRLLVAGDKNQSINHGGGAFTQKNDQQLTINTGESQKSADNVLKQTSNFAFAFTVDF